MFVQVSAAEGYLVKKSSFVFLIEGHRREGACTTTVWASLVSSNSISALYRGIIHPYWEQNFILKLILQDDVYEDRESDPRQIINTGELCQIMFQIENCIIIYCTCCMKPKNGFQWVAVGMSFGWSSGCHSALLHADLQPASQKSGQGSGETLFLENSFFLPRLRVSKKKMCVQMHSTSLVVPLSLNSVIFSIFRIFFSRCVFSFSKSFLTLLFQG